MNKAKSSPTSPLTTPYEADHLSRQEFVPNDPLSVLPQKLRGRSWTRTVHLTRCLFQPQQNTHPQPAVGHHRRSRGGMGRNPIAGPNENLVLSSNDPTYYHADKSSSSFPTKAQVYIYVDSINYDTTYGVVKESDEGNNLGGPVVSTNADYQPPAIESGGAAVAVERLPER
ncbi:MAG: hypothetical protein GY869_18930 [Planctomycetes bacterium]|nr:hypothetical protein [Planctomycetota bacterium]